MSAKKTAKLDFEATLKELESIVNAIEKGGTNLEESLGLFAKGVALTKECQETLKAAEQKVKILTGKDLADFATEDNDDDDDEEE
ncbi:Exodeoxyribonuclease 7 small subunit [Gammaproteobacteria bacterium]